MSELFEKSLRTLELPRVLEMLSAQAVSDEAKRRCLALRPETDIEDVERLQEETEAALLEKMDEWEEVSTQLEEAEA